MSLIDRGLDLLNPDATSREEAQEFRKFYQKAKGRSLPAFDFWLAHRPDVLKRHRLRARMADTDEGRKYPLRSLLAVLHYYTIIGFKEGISYEINDARNAGATKGDVLDTLSVAFLHAGPRGMHVVSQAAHKYMSKWVDEGHPAADRFPPGWEFDPEAFVAGLDYSSPVLSAGDLALLRRWYERTLGEVPAHVEFLAVNRPKFLKALRNRFEHAIRDSLPKQMMPYLLIHFSTIRGFPDGLREAVLLGKAFGLTREQVIDAICWAGSYAGQDGVTIAAKAASDVFAIWT